MSPKHISEIPEYIEETKRKKDGSKETVQIPRRAIAPYNFVELPEKVVEAEPLPSGDFYHQNRHTGRIECTLTTESPLYTRCGWSPKNFAEYEETAFKDLSDEIKKLRANFFINPATNQPVIPGSSIRGMLRTLVEIVSFSKIDRVFEQQLIYRAVGDTTSLGEKYRVWLLEKQTDNSYKFLMKAGYLVKESNSWKIQPAQLIQEDTSFARIEKNDIPKNLEPWYGCQNAYKISIKVAQVTTHNHGKGKQIKLRYAKAHPISTGEYNGVLVTTGFISGKHMEFVFGKPSENSSDAIPITTEIIEQYKEQITDGQINILGEDAALRSMQPVFYILENDQLVFFGHAMMFRLPYESCLSNFVPKDLRKIGLIDLADAIFGWVKKETENEKLPKDFDKQRAGRVFVTDALYKSDQNGIWYEEKPLPPKILSSPKPTTFQHYLVQQSVTKSELKHYASEPLTETVIRGHKLYWHKGSNPDFKLPPPPKPKKVIDPQKKVLHTQTSQVSDTQTTQTTLIKPIHKGVTFKFDIYFENLSDVELGALLWVLDIAKDDAYRLKLGMGKPLGLGAVKIEPTLYLSSRQERYQKLFDCNESWEIGETESSQDMSDYVSRFESYMLEKLNHTGVFKNLCRIQMLLQMLRWPGLEDVEKTRYMEIERDINKPFIGKHVKPTDKTKTVNEYKERPVLPNPLDVMGIKIECERLSPSVHKKSTE